MKHDARGRGTSAARRRAGIAAVLVGLGALCGCSITSPATALRQAGAPPPSQAIPKAPAASCGKPAGNRYLGISVARTSLIAPTEQAMGIAANVVSLYYAIGQAINMQAIASLCARHVFPVIELDDGNHSPAQIASGADDKALESYALAIGTMQAPVGIVFDHEFNGPWFPWGYTHATAAQFVAAWRHIVTVFRDYGATRVTWIWNPNVASRWTAPDLRAWYPGDAYVSWVGLDGYFYAPTDTFGSVFGHTIGEVSALTTRPVMIMETGASPASGRARAITSVFQGVEKTPGLLGLIYFDFDKTAVHDWYINDDPSALAAFRAEASSFMGAAG